jgi:hypothetical protein
VAFDPGYDTGVAYFYRGILTVTHVLPGDDRAWQYRTIANLLTPIASANGAEKVVVCEGYTAPRGLDRSSMETVMLIGWIYGHALCNNLPFFQQMPPAKKPFLEATKFKGKTLHERDAVAQGYAWLSKHCECSVPV